MNEASVSALIEQKIFLICGCRVMLDRDLAELYGVSTKRLNEQVKRNSRRFPDDFMFRLNEKEKRELVAICDRFKTLKHSSATPFAFTEQGVAMLSSVLNSDRAIQVNILIMRAFVKIREILSVNKDLVVNLNKLEERMEKQDADIHIIFQAIRQLMAPSRKRKKPAIGFHVK